MMINFAVLKNQTYANKNLPCTQKRGNVNLQALKQDTLTFSANGNIKPPTFSDFKTRFDKLKISEKEFIRTCASNEPIGKGFEGEVYEVSFNEFDAYLIKVPLLYNLKEVTALEKIKDDFPDENFGQPVAAIGEIEVLKKTKGISLRKLSTKNPRKYYADLAKMPQKSFDDFVKNITTINEKGYRFDSNSGNVLLDSKNKKLNIIDLMNRYPWVFVGDCLYPFISDVKDIEPISNKKLVIAKIFKAAKKHDIKFGMNDNCFERLFEEQDKSSSDYLSDTLEKFLTLGTKDFNTFIDKEIAKYQK